MVGASAGGGPAKARVHATAKMLTTGNRAIVFMIVSPSIGSEFAAAVVLSFGREFLSYLDTD
jgi:hypothetical protein